MTKEELLRTDPPKGSMSWQPQDNSVTFKGSANIHDNEGEVSMSGSKKKRRFQWRRNADSSKKHETQKQQNESPAQQNDKKQNTPVSPEELRKELNDSHSVPLTNDELSKTDFSGMSWQSKNTDSSKKKETQTQTQQNAEAPQQNTPTRRSYSTSVNDKGYLTPEELFQRAPEQTSVQSSSPVAANENENTTSDEVAEEAKDEEQRPLSYAELFKQLNPQLTEEQKKEIAKKEKRKRILAAISDGVGALSNLYFSSKGAPSTFDSRNTLSQRNQVRYDKMMNDRKANEEAYRQGLMKAEQMDREWKWRKDESDRNQGNLDRSHQLEQSKFEHTKQQSGIANKLNQDKYNEDIRQFDENMKLQWAKLNAEKDKNAADSAYKRYVMNGGGKNSDKNKRTVLTAEDGKEVSIHTGVWENAVPQLFNIMMEEGIDPYPQLSGMTRTNALKEMTPEEIENFVKGQWQKSPRAVTLMMHMSELDPYSMQSQTGKGFDKKFGDVTIPYSTWNTEMDNIFDLMMQEGGYGVYSDKDAALVKTSKIGKLTSEDKEKIIMSHWQDSPSARQYIQKIGGSNNNTAPYLKTDDNNDNTAPYLRNQ